MRNFCLAKYIEYLIFRVESTCKYEAVVDQLMTIFNEIDKFRLIIFHQNGTVISFVPSLVNPILQWVYFQLRPYLIVIIFLLIVLDFEKLFRRLRLSLEPADQITVC